MQLSSILFLNRVYPPAEGATGQLLAELAEELVRRGHSVTVVTSPADSACSKSEVVNGVRVERVGGLAFNRSSHWRRALSYLSLYPVLLRRAWQLPAHDIVVTLTDPPLQLLLGPVLQWAKGSKLVHWAQDIYPELAEEMGVLHKGGWLASGLRRLSTWALRRSDGIIAVGQCMKTRLVQRGLMPENISVISNWGHLNAECGVRNAEHSNAECGMRSAEGKLEFAGTGGRAPSPGGEGRGEDGPLTPSAVSNAEGGVRNAEWANEGGPLTPGAVSKTFRTEHGLDGKFVVMYSGNLGLAHPFEAMLDAAERLRSALPQVAFVFVGSGPRLPWVRQQAERRHLDNVRFLPFQPKEKLNESLAAADVHLASMRQELCGLVVPSKVFGVLAAGRPCVFLGPEESEAAQIILQHGCGSVLSKATGARLAACLTQWVKHPESLREARERAEGLTQRVNLGAAVEQFEKVFSRVTSPNAPAVLPALPAVAKGNRRLAA